MGQKLEKDLQQVPEVIAGRPAWERLDDETGKAWEAFQHYRDQGPKRTFEETGRFVDAARITDAHQRLRERFERKGLPVPPPMDPDQVELRTQRMQKVKGHRRSVQRVRHWAKRFHWYQRTVHFDRHMDKIRVDALEEEARDMAKRHLSLSGLLQNKAARRLQMMEEDELTTKNVLDYIMEGVKLERLTREMSTDNRQVTNKVIGDEAANEAKEILKRKLENISKLKEQSEQRVKDGRRDDRGVVEILEESVADMSES
jgi:hypothetical protein